MYSNYNISTFYFFIGQVAGRYDLYINPINRQISLHAGPKWGTRVKLVPHVFKHYETKDKVEKKRLRAGYTKNNDLKWGIYKEDIKKGSIVYSRDGSRIPCNIIYIVIIQLNDADLLIHAEGTKEETGCL